MARSTTHHSVDCWSLSSFDEDRFRLNFYFFHGVLIMINRKNFQNLLGLILPILFGVGCPTSNSQAFEMGVIGGIQTTDVKVSDSSLSTSSDVGFRGGVLGFAEITREAYIRTGVAIGQRKFSLQSEGMRTQGEFLYLEVPVTLLYLFNEHVGFYAGAELGIKLSDSARSNDVTSNAAGWINPNSLIFGPTIGGHFRFTPDLGMELGYVYGLNTMVEGPSGGNQKISEASGVQVSLMFIF